MEEEMKPGGREKRRKEGRKDLRSLTDISKDINEVSLNFIISANIGRTEHFSFI